MSAWNFYLLSALPGLPELGAKPPLTVSEFMDMLIQEARGADLVRILVLAEDLRLRESFLNGESEQTPVVVLSRSQARNEAPLPEHLVVAEEAEAELKAPADAVWANYYRYAAGQARRLKSPFLQAWVGREVALRNALALQRAKTLELDGQDYLVASELADEDADFTALLNEWGQAATPLAGHQVIERNRWNWLVEQERWFSFQDDEIAAYAAKLIALHRWHRVLEGQPTGASAG